MTYSIKIERPRALLLALLGLALAMSVGGCSKITAGGCPGGKTACECICTSTGAAEFCGSPTGTDPAGTQACENDCIAMNTSTSFCNDASDHVVTPQSNPPVCPAGETWAAWVFCETCHDGLQSTIVDDSCTQAAGLTDAQNHFTDLNPDDPCSIDLCKDQS